ncbi:MAG: DUF2235 domain-containing protein [Myxococcota bacterium]|nr:DUF2235 domain-containing protein [Myxococcota bacterium]
MPKDIIILVDGTGNEPGDEGKPDEDVTNVFLMADRILQSIPGQQEVSYLKGIATSRLYFVDKISFAMGLGWNRRKRKARRIVRKAYQRGDRVFLIGFSRGAAIVRDLSNDLEDAGIPTFALVLWDTVAAFGLPTEVFGISQQVNVGKNLAIPSSVRHVHHLLALDEVREPFTPSLCREREGLELDELWFPGDHLDVGGGRHERALADLSLKWAIDRLSRYDLKFRAAAIDAVDDAPLSGADVHRAEKPTREKIRSVTRVGPDGRAVRARLHPLVPRLLEAQPPYAPQNLEIPLTEHYDLDT